VTAVPEPGQGRIDLSRLDIPVGFASHHGLEGGMQLIAIARSLGKETEKGISN
jgi:hypothetical protein